MAQPVSLAPTAAEPIRVPVWAWFLVATSAFALYLMTMDNSMLGVAAETSHEFFHDARHFIGVPCH